MDHPRWRQADAGGGHAPEAADADDLADAAGGAVEIGGDARDFGRSPPAALRLAFRPGRSLPPARWNKLRLRGASGVQLHAYIDQQGWTMEFAMQDGKIGRRELIGLAGVGVAAVLLGSTSTLAVSAGKFQVSHTPADWRRLLGPERYAVLREASTERPFSSPLLNEHRRGFFVCAGCGLPLFSSAAKFESGTGWPSFWQPLAERGRRRDGPQPRDGADRSAVPTLRRAPRPRVRRRSQADRPALLHERSCVQVRRRLIR